MLTDTHAHLYWDSFREDFDEVIKRSLDAGVTTIINVGVDVEKSKEAVQVSKKLALSGVEGFSTIGIHPHEALRYAQGKPFDQFTLNYRSAQGKLSEDMDKLEQIYLSAPVKVVAVGECGLDITPTDLQVKLLQSQVNLAKKLDLPLIIHCRDDRSQNPTNTDCWDKVIEMTKDHFGIYHCYSGLAQTTERIIDKTNFLVSFAATITYPKNDYLREAARIIPLDRIVLETDCPFLPPQSKRGQRNEPSTVKEIAQLVADLKSISFAEVARQTTKNAQKIFSSTNSTLGHYDSPM